MLGQIAEAQAALESDIELLRHAAAMSGDGAALAMAQGQMSRLAGLQHRIEHAHGGGLAAIRAEVMASVAASQTLAQQVRGTIAYAHAAEVALHAASAAARREVTSFAHDFYERKIFDPYLRFASPEEEAAYRQREEERQRAIKDAMATGTPEGNLRALELAQDQLRDAGAHGATNSPEFQGWVDRLGTQNASLNSALGNPPDHPQSTPVVASADPLEDIAASAQVDAGAFAAFRAAGIVMADQSQQGHGLTAAPLTPSAVGRA
ncbi:MAG: hypothetical protein K2Y04_06970 [Caulobacteraceae bacterium]|nr:hypothetical protein [Caulobacteraceae bacterium]